MSIAARDRSVIEKVIFATFLEGWVMKHLQVMGLTALLVLGFSGALLAQFPRPGDPFFDALRELHRSNPDREILELLLHPDYRREIQTEIELTDDDWGEFSSKLDSARVVLQELRDKYRQSPATSKEDVKVELQAALEPVQLEAFQLLESKANLDRLLGIYVQLKGASSASSDKVAAKIGLSGEALEAFRAAKSRKWSELMNESRDRMQSAVRSSERNDKIHAIFANAERELERYLVHQLDDDQNEKLSALKGEEVDGLDRIRKALPPRRGSGRPRGGRSGDGPPGPPRHEGER